MAACTLKDNKADTTNTTSYVSNSFTPTASSLLVVFVEASATLAAGTLTDSQGLGFTRIASATHTTGADSIYLFVANALAAASAMTVTFDCTGDAATGAMIFVYQVTSVTRTGASAVLQSQVVSDHATSVPSIVFPANVQTGNPTLGIVADGNNPAGLTPPTGWTEGADIGYASPNRGAEVVSRDSGYTSSGMNWNTPAPGTNWGGIIVEIDTSVASGTTFNQALAVSGGTWAAAMVRQPGKILAVTATCTATIKRGVGKVLAVTATCTATVAKAVTKALSVGATFTAACAKGAVKTLAVGATFTAGMVRRTGKALAVGTAWPAGMGRQTGKLLAASGSWVASLSMVKAFLRTLSVTATFSVSMTRRIGKTLSTAVSWVAGLVTVFQPLPQPSYFLPPTELYLHSKDRFEWTTDEHGKTQRGLSAEGRYRGFNRNQRATQRPSDPEGYYSVGAFMFRGGYWNGPLSDAEVAAITAAGLAGRIRQAREPGLLPPGVD